MRRLADVSQGDVVLPGDRLCVIEELSPSHGTYEEQGIVYAATLGGVDIDLKSRSISVRNPEGSVQLHLPVRDDILTGEVIRVFDQRAEVSIVRRNGKDLLSALQAEIHISNVTRRFVKSMHDALRQGDIIRAVALNTHTIPVELSLVGQDLGVLFAKCVKSAMLIENFFQDEKSLLSYQDQICEWTIQYFLILLRRVGREMPSTCAALVRFQPTWTSVFSMCSFSIRGSE